MWFSMEGESRLVEGRYAPIPVAGMEGGTLTARSEVLGLKLRLTPGALVREALRFLTRYAGSPCEASGKRRKPVKKRSEGAKQLKPACGRNRRRGKPWKPRSRSYGGAVAEEMRGTVRAQLLHFGRAYAGEDLELQWTALAGRTFCRMLKRTD